MLLNLTLYFVPYIQCFYVLAYLKVKKKLSCFFQNFSCFLFNFQLHNPYGIDFLCNRKCGLSHLLSCADLIDPVLFIEKIILSQPHYTVTFVKKKTNKKPPQVTALCIKSLFVDFLLFHRPIYLSLPHFLNYRCFRIYLGI